ncbi:MAG: FKBP-type peptidyl-prolyl cis-trans isomerase [Bacteroidales bacterium]|nr:FKBP-type peptidyl-prolyl cis-trans isomerase [Bacteroidales bacterium]MBQ8810960.1 FKBP-type peptidyl-prolyl cis-trans isomerase [Bacteroidales bacterium]
MNKIIKTAAYITLAFAVSGCAKSVEEGPNDADKRYFDAWMQINHPDARPSGLGVYIIEEEEGTGIEVKEGGYVYADYVTTDLEGNIATYTDKNTAKMLGTYDTTAYYGARVISTIENTIQAGLAETLTGMKAGGRKKVIIPGWLMSYSVYDNEEDYLNASSSGSATIYDITVRDYTDSIDKHEISLIEKYIADNPTIFNDKIVNDTTGFYYQQLAAGTTDKAFSKDTTIYINYTGKLLNGLVFDTTDEKTAKDNGLYSSTKKYEPVKVKWGEKYSDITMGSNGSSVISGFALTLWHMHPFEKGIGVFYSPLGYTYNGSGSSIPSYAPLVFEIEIVAEPED